LAPLAAQTSALVSFEAPNAGRSSGQGTAATSINKNGSVAGYYFDPLSKTHAFVRSVSGEITEFDAPGLVGTSAAAINGAGQIVGTGQHLSQTNPVLGFLRYPNGTFVLLEAPSPCHQTLPVSINDNGQIAGYCIDSANAYHSFVRDAGGNYTVFDEPNAVKDVSGSGTFVLGINSNGVTTGSYDDEALVNHGFTRDQFGNFTSFDSPGGGNCIQCGTLPNAINLGGTVCGDFTNTTSMHSFVRDPLGNVTDYDAPGAVRTYSVAINDGGEIAGAWLDSQFQFHGFIRDASGSFTSFSAPFPSIFVFAYGINNLGRVTGYYTDGRGVNHGFLR
jgi:hypothetical protein